MKTALTLIIVALVGLPFGAFAQDNPSGLTVHEWGTFTTLSGSNGSQLEGLYFEEEQLPKFVHHHSGFSPDPIVTDKGVYLPCDLATVKMETPVVYFYAQKETPVSLKVRFPGGTISQWYPQRTDGEAAPTQEAQRLNFGKPYNGWIQWDATVLAPTDKRGLSPEPQQETHTWVAPRATDANTVVCKDEAEKFLFYRGVGNLQMPLSAKFSADGNLVIRNTGADAIPYLFIYQKTTTGASVWWTGALAQGEEKIVAPNSEPMPQAIMEKELAGFRNGLVAAGLYEKEAAAMLETWHTSYFGYDGLKVFWVVPERLTEQILPMEITPKPERIARVLVGRSEIMTPKFEQAIFAELATPEGRAKWEKDRYYLAYQQRAKQLQTLAVDENSTDSRLNIQPNPVTNTLKVECAGIADENLALEITDLAGRVVLTREVISTSSGIRLTLGVAPLPKGTYYIRVFGEKTMRRGVFVK